MSKILYSEVAKIAIEKEPLQWPYGSLQAGKKL
jgi:hypothetical protein